MVARRTTTAGTSDEAHTKVSVTCQILRPAAGSNLPLPPRTPGSVPKKRKSKMKIKSRKRIKSKRKIKSRIQTSRPVFAGRNLTLNHALNLLPNLNLPLNLAPPAFSAALLYSGGEGQG